MNTSFSPPPARWDNRFEGIQNGSNDSIQLGSTSSNSKESRSWMRGVGGYHHTHQFEAGVGVMYCSSPSDTSLIHPWTPPPMQSVSMDDFETSAKQSAISGPSCFTPTMEGTSMARDGVGSTSSRSECSELDHSGKLHLSTPRNFPSRRSFKSKPIHPLSFPIQPPFLETSGLFDYNPPPSSSNSSSIDLSDILHRFSPDSQTGSSNPSGPHKCGVCDRFLSQRSPWSSRRIVKNGDMPVTGILSCQHVFHADCLEQNTQKTHTSDPPCPICTKSEGDSSNSPEQQLVFPKLRNSLSRIKGFSGGEGSSKSWGCVQVGDCVEGAHRSRLMLLNRNKMKKNLSLKGNAKRSGSNPLNFFGGRCVDHGAGPSIKK